MGRRRQMWREMDRLCVCEKERDTIIERETYSLRDRETGWMDGWINR